MHLHRHNHSLSLTERLFAAATYEAYVSADQQHQIIEAALTSKPYSPLTQWLMQLYESLANIPTGILHLRNFANPIAISADGSSCHWILH